VRWIERIVETEDADPDARSHVLDKSGDVIRTRVAGSIVQRQERIAKERHLDSLEWDAVLAHYEQQLIPAKSQELDAGECIDAA
jgi:hypothetical protein